MNPAAFTHYSYGLADAAHMVIDEGLPLMEVHISNPSARRRISQAFRDLASSDGHYHRYGVLWLQAGVGCGGASVGIEVMIFRFPLEIVSEEL